MLKKMLAAWDTSKGMSYSNVESMDRVLEICEENGMNPPRYEILNSGINDIYPVFQWEDE